MEESSEKKRGRPKLHDFKAMGIPASYLNARTERGNIELMLGSRAFCLIHSVWEAAGKPSDHWAVGYYIDDRGKGDVLHKSVLAALGRLEVDDDLIEMAQHMAVQKASTRRAVVVLRELRIGKMAKTDGLSLLLHIEKAIAAYQETHEGADKAFIVKTLREMADLYDEPE